MVERMRKILFQNLSSTGTFTYDVKGQLSTETYDSNGNATVSGARTFAYDFENRLKSMKGGAVTLQYDGDGNRVVKRRRRRGIWWMS